VDPPGGVLLERRTADAEDVYASRVTDAGEVWRWTTVRASVTDGEVAFERGPGAWERMGVLTADALADLRAAVDAADVHQLPDELRAAGPSGGGLEETWTVAGRTVTVQGAPEGRGPQLEALAGALDAALAAVAG
jgi:hypothetical protein